MSTVIRVENLSKRYVLGSIDRQMLYEDLQRRWARLMGKGDPFATVNGPTPAKRATHEEIWALRDVNFTINDGDVVGIIGRNGSGKSTLLKILSKITAPTKGRALLKGRVASLLEVGTGFHAELTGRENVYLNGSILGMTRQELDGKFDEIVEFSGVEKFIDTPVKRYSSGMMVRLAFAVAAHIDPEILIIDEVLAVGDAAFQQKCLGKISSAARAGRTVLFVSHNAAAVENLCRRGIVLENGAVKFDGTQTEAINFYSQSLNSGAISLRDRRDRGGSGGVRVVGIELRSPEGRALSSAAAGQDVDVHLLFENHTGHPYPRLGAQIRVATQYEVPVFIQYNRLTAQQFGDVPSSGSIVCRLKCLPLPPSTYQLSFYITAEDTRDQLDSMTNAAELVVEGGDFFGTGELPPASYGTCLVAADWRLESTATDRQAPTPAAA
jgi:lipopolysaccharide transport system ATP-binding protein